ncbi:hypothetical protein AURDEDRAFT_127751 [Auricularia subglabra TFB-10046 SS5]|nr:hypothetical protein AURDEDRAFT_127751 [Auricularia subglabra TFB-10046 SS5]
MNKLNSPFHGSPSSVSAELRAMLRAAHAGLSRATTEWNTKSDKLRGLPLELVQYCWSFLGTPDLVKAASVSQAWRIMILDMPALWSVLEFHLSDAEHYDELDVLLRRSRDLKVSLAVHFAGYGLYYQNWLSTVLQTHGHRLTRLDFPVHPDRYTPYGSHRASPPFLDFEAPSLRSFSSGLRSFTFDSLAFRGSCQSLQHVRLANLPKINGAQIFSGVTSLSFAAEGDEMTPTLTGLYLTFPGLVRLEVDFGKYGYWPPPPIPPGFPLPRGVPLPTTLQHVVLKHINPSYKDISDLGFTQVPTLEVHGGDNLGDATKLFLAFGGGPCTASVVEDQMILSAERVDTSKRGLSRSIRVSFPFHLPRGHLAALEVPAIRDSIRELSFLPSYYPDRPINRRGFEFAFPPQEFPALQTLILPVDGPLHPLVQLRDMERCGKLCAPNLRCLVLSRVPDRSRQPLCPSIPPTNIALLIANHLALAPGRMPEELVLEEGWVTLEETGHECEHGLEVLESYVGTILVKPTDAFTQLL